MLFSKKLIKAIIREGIRSEMPSIQHNWHFNFEKTTMYPSSKFFVLVHENTPKVIEGCIKFSNK